MGPVKVCFLVHPGQARYFDTVASYQDLLSRAHTKYLHACGAMTSPGTPRPLLLAVTGDAAAPWFAVDGEAAYQKLEMLYIRGLAAARSTDGRSARVRIELRAESLHRHWDEQVQAVCLEPSTSSPPQPHNSQSQASSWDEDALSSIKKSVAQWHFGTRLHQHLAA